MSYPVTILTLFPDMFPGALGHSITGRALEKGLWQLRAQDIRDHALANTHKTVDDTPYGGGAGMVMRADVVAGAIRAARAAQPGAKVVYLTPTGQPFTQNKAAQLAAHESGLIVLCGHYEGIDQRAIDAEVDAEISLGDFVLTGGEVAAGPFIDAVIRLLPGVLGKSESAEDESFSIGAAREQLLEYPHYTRPAVWEGRAVPDVLTGGNHAEIDKWRLNEARARTRARRPDLLEKK